MKVKVEKLGLKDKIKIELVDALDLNSLADNSVDKIVTDPPWGFYFGQGWDLSSFYTAMLKEFSRVIKPNGLMVILIAKKDIFENLLERFFNQLELVKKFNILVSGKKAGVYKIRKLP
jgi:tRNA G10  N-methylase Trm11